jgi:hypothetical protein
VFFRHGECGLVHDLEAICNGGVVAQPIVSLGVWVLLGVAVVNAVDLCRLDDYVGVNFEGS